MEQVERLARYQVKALVIESTWELLGCGAYRSRMNPRSVIREHDHDLREVKDALAEHVAHALVRRRRTGLRAGPGRRRSRP